MNGIRDALNWIFPAWWIIGVWLGFLALAFIYHFLANNQSLANKKNNAKKYAIAFGAMAIVSAVAQVMASEHARVLHPIIIAIFVWVLFEIADWASYGCHLWPRHPGGFQGWFWRNVLDMLKVLRDGAQQRYEDAIDPAEIQLAKAKAAAIQVHSTKTKRGK